LNTVDVACGWLGGWLGARIARRFPSSPY